MVTIGSDLSSAGVLTDSGSYNYSDLDRRLSLTVAGRQSGLPSTERHRPTVVEVMGAVVAD